MSQPELSLKQVLELAVTTEELGAKYYQELAGKFSDEPELVSVFDRLGKDELAHAAAFRKLAAQAAPDQKVGPNDEAYFVLRAAATSEFFSQESMQDTSGVKTPADALAKAIGLEKSTLFYYQSVKDSLGASPELDSLIAAEKSHLMALMRVIVSDAKFRGIGDPW